MTSHAQPRMRANQSGYVGVTRYRGKYAANIRLCTPRGLVTCVFPQRPTAQAAAQDYDLLITLRAQHPAHTGRRVSPTNHQLGLLPNTPHPDPEPIQAAFAHFMQGGRRRVNRFGYQGIESGGRRYYAHLMNAGKVHWGPGRASPAQAAQDYDLLITHLRQQGLRPPRKTNHERGLLPTPPDPNDLQADWLQDQRPAVRAAQARRADEQLIAALIAQLPAQPAQPETQSTPVQIPLYQHRQVVAYALVDEADAPQVSAYRWSHVLKRGKPSAKLAKSAAHSRALGFYTIPQLLLGARHISHRNGNGLDCQRSNLLRLPPHGQHRLPRAVQASGGEDVTLPFGVYGSGSSGSRKYMSRVRFNGQSHVTPAYHTPLEASIARDLLILRLQGPDAPLNHPALRQALLAATERHAPADPPLPPRCASGQSPQVPVQ